MQAFGQFAGILSNLNGFLGVNLAALHQLKKMGVQLPHPVFGSGLDFRFQLENFIFADEVGDGRGGYHDFKTGHAPSPGFG